MFALLINIIGNVIHQEFSFKIDDQSFSGGGVCFWLSVCLIMSGTTSDQTLNNICNSGGNGKCRMNPFDSNVKSRDQIILLYKYKGGFCGQLVSASMAWRPTESFGSWWSEIFYSGKTLKLSESQKMMHFGTLHRFLNGVSLSCLSVPLIQF